MIILKEEELSEIIIFSFRNKKVVQQQLDDKNRQYFVVGALSSPLTCGKQVTIVKLKKEQKFDLSSNKVYQQARQNE